MRRLARVGLSVSIVGGVILLASAFGYRLGLLPLRFALLTLLRWGAYVGIAGIALSAVALLGGLRQRSRPRPTGLALAGLVVGALVVAPPAIQQYYRVQQAPPPIHDITTNTEDPPVFVDVLPLRAQAPNTAEYGGAKIAALQRQAYPDLETVVLPMPMDRAFAHTLAAVESMGWQMVGYNREAGRIEATDTTFWFGFKDDVVVRLRPDGEQTRVDVRSVSRVGGGDVGANARRIRALITKVKPGPD